MTTPACPRYAGYRFPAEIISHAVWLYFRFPLSLQMVDEPLAARGIIVSHETVCQWALKFGQAFANQIRRRLPAAFPCHDHRQAGELRGGQAPGDAFRLASEAQRPEQQSGELAPADVTTRTADEAVQVAWPGATPFVRPWREQQPFPPPPASSARHPVSSRPDPSSSGLGRGHRRRRFGVTTSAPSSSCASATYVQQVDGAVLCTTPALAVRQP